MRIATLFSGIGAPEQGATRVYGDKLETVFACEFDKFARQSYEANYDIAPEHFHKDVNDLDATQYRGKVDILIGGSPCQAFSIAGLRNGTADERGQLIYQYIRVVEECMPDVIVYENVKGMMSITGGRTIKEFVQALRDIGYYCHYDVINTKDYGVPQNRERLFLVGFLDHESYHRFHFAPKMPLEKRLKDVLESDVDEKYYLDRELNLTYESQANTIHDTNKEAPTLCAFTHGYAGGYIQDLNRVNRTLRVGGGSSLSDKHCFDLVQVKEPQINTIGLLDCKGTDQIRIVYGTDGIAATLTTMQGGNQEPKIIDFTNDFGEDNYREYSDYSPALRSEMHGLGVHESRIRKLTPIECLRLQDFPDTFMQTVSDSQMYKQTGNSMSVNILEMIFNQIEKAKSNAPTNTLMDFIGETA